LLAILLFNGHHGAAKRQSYPVVFFWCMSKARTNIEIEDGDVQMIMERYGARTKTEAVNLALRHLAGQPMTREEALAMRGVRAMVDMPGDAAPAGLE